MCEKELCENEDCTKQIHYLSSSSGFKIAISKSYRFIFTLTYIHFFVTFKLLKVSEIFVPLIAYVIKGGILSWALKEETSCQNVMVIEQWTIKI